MSKYSRSCDNNYWAQRQRAFSLNSQRQQEILQQSIANNYSIPLHYNGEKKREKSVDIFSSNRISTCSFVKRRGSEYEAAPFYSRPLMTAVLEPLSQPSFPKQSATSDSFRNPEYLHAGMGAKKPLEPYRPNAMRSRLPSPDFKQFYINRSLVEIGDRLQTDSKHYTTTNRNKMGRNPYKKFVSRNPGIINYQVKWDNQLRDK